MWVRLQLDFTWWDLAHSMSCLLRQQATDALKKSLNHCWSSAGNALPVLSVRSGLDLLLGTLAWPAGSEVVYSALNIPDMAMVARQHALVPVPADLDIERLAPN